MRITELTGRRSKDSPKEAVLPSQQFLSRGAYFRSLDSQNCLILPCAQRIIAKISALIRQEAQSIGGQEIGLLTDIINISTVLQNLSYEIESYRQLPACFYAIERQNNHCSKTTSDLFYLKKLTNALFYAFCSNQSNKNDFYLQLAAYFQNIFHRCGLKNIIQATAGTNSMQEPCTHEFVYIHTAGRSKFIDIKQDTAHKHWQNINIATTDYSYPAEKALPLTKVATLNCSSIKELTQFLQIPAQRIGKIVLLQQSSTNQSSTNQLIAVFLRGDLQVNEFLIKQFLNISDLEFATDQAIMSVGICPGYGSLHNIDLDKITLLVDQSITDCPNIVIGANEVDYHLLNFNFQRDLNKGHIGHFSLVQSLATNGCVLAKTAFFNPQTTDNIKATYHDSSGKSQNLWPCCGQLSIENLIPAIIEEHHDRFGPIWPSEIAPFQVQLCVLDSSCGATKQYGQEIYHTLQNNNIDVLLDEREIRAGVMFAEADLIAAPLRLTISTKTAMTKQFELSKRGEKEKTLHYFPELLNIIHALLLHK